jgi:DNA-binding LacI/PurR family transcriptional regulator
MPSTTSGTPKYLQLKHDLAEQIRSGALGPGDRIKPERELMRHYQVSYATVTRALTELRDAGLIERSWGKGTFVREQTSTVANLAITFDQAYTPLYPYLLPFINGINREAVLRGVHVQLFPLPRTQIFAGGSGSLFVSLLRERRLDGVLACDPHSPEDIVQLECWGVPTVSLLNEYPGTQCAAVMSDDADGARQLAELLVGQLGHRRVLLLMGPELGRAPRRARSSAILAESLMRELRERGAVCPRSAVLLTNFEWDEIAADVRSRLTSNDRPTAILTCSDLLAQKTIELARELGLRVPEDLSVTGWGDVLGAAELTTVRVPLTEIAETGLRLLLDRQVGRPVTAALHPVQLVVHGTTAPAPTSTRAPV